MDNAGSFARLAPRLAETCHVAAVTLPGHGLSDHAGPSGEYHQALNVDAVLRSLNHLGWLQAGEDGRPVRPDVPVVLVGHSMGAAVLASVASGLAGCKGAVAGLALIEGHGFYTRPAEEAAGVMRRAVEGRATAMLAGQGEARGPRALPSLAAAAERRSANVKALGDGQSLSIEGAEALVAWGLRPATDDEDDESVAFTHDAGLRRQSMWYTTEEQVCAVLGGVAQRSMLVTASCGWPWKAAAIAARAEALGPVRELRLVGAGHHPHLDPLTAGLVADNVCEFLESMPR